MKKMENELEEAAETYADFSNDYVSLEFGENNFNETTKRNFIEGAKWQMDKQSDFIIGFLEFIEGTYSYSNIYDHWYLHANTSKTYSKKQLLEVYLKRNKL